MSLQLSPESANNLENELYIESMMILRMSTTAIGVNVITLPNVRTWTQMCKPSNTRIAAYRSHNAYQNTIS
jgi:hypothetical protein